MGTTPRVILILKQASSAARLHKTLAQKIVVTVSDRYDQLIENLLEVFLQNHSVTFLVSLVKRRNRTLS